MKYFWPKEDIHIADELLSLVPNLRDEFLAHHKDFDTTFKGGVPYSKANPLAICQVRFHRTYRWVQLTRKRMW